MLDNLNSPKNIKKFVDNKIFTLGRFRTNFNLLFDNLREIYHSNYSFFAFSFILLYALEQILLLYFSIKLSPELALGIGLFVLIMLTTIAIERLLMESRTKRIFELNSEYLYQNKKSQDNLKILEKQNKELIDYIAHDLKQ